MIDFEAVILAGGRSSRMRSLKGLPTAGKSALVIDGKTLLDHALDAAWSATSRVVVGPAAVARAGLVHTQEEPPFGGPAAGVAAGMKALPGTTEFTMVLGCDAPRVAWAVSILLESAATMDPGIDGVRLTRDARAQWLPGIYRRERLQTVIDSSGQLAGARLSAILKPLRCIEIEDHKGYSADLDLPEHVRDYRLESSADADPA